jgi:hypothetical protein
MSKARAVVAACLIAVAAAAGLAGCGSDARAGAVIPNTATPVRRAATPVPTATLIPNGA